MTSQPLRMMSCARDVVATGQPLNDAAQLAQGCAGGLRLHTRENQHLESDTPTELAFDVGGNRCLRVLAASDGPSLRVNIVGEHGQALAGGGWGESLAAAPLLGPLCVRVPTRLRVTVSAALAADVVAELWQSEGP